MKGELFFEIPDDQEVMAKIVEAVPLSWSWIDGGLRAPSSMVASGQVEENTGFTLQRFHSIHPTIIGRYAGGKNERERPNLFAIMVEQKLPGFISFNEAGYDADIITLELAKSVAVGFLRKGYRGGLYFYKDCYDNRKHDNPAYCEIIFQPWQGAPICQEEAGAQPSRVKLRWESRYGGKEEDIAPIVAVCRSLGLSKYTPTPGPLAPPQLAI